MYPFGYLALCKMSLDTGATQLPGHVGKEDLARRWKAYIFDHCKLVDPDFKFEDCRDPDDVVFVECAVSAGASYIVSGDKHLLEIKNLPGVTVLTVTVQLFSMYY